MERLFKGATLKMVNDDLKPVLDCMYNFIRSYIKQHGFSPSQREISDACHVGRTTVSHYLDKLVIQGRITRIAGQARSLGIIDPDKPTA